MLFCFQYIGFSAKIERSCFFEGSVGKFETKSWKWSTGWNGAGKNGVALFSQWMPLFATGCLNINVNKVWFADQHPVNIPSKTSIICKP